MVAFGDATVGHSIDTSCDNSTVLDSSSARISGNPPGAPVCSGKTGNVSNANQWHVPDVFKSLLPEYLKAYFRSLLKYFMSELYNSRHSQQLTVNHVVWSHKYCCSTFIYACVKQ